VALRSGRRNGPSQTKKLSLDFSAAIRELLIVYFIEIVGTPCPIHGVPTVAVMIMAVKLKPKKCPALMERGV
jgi:hypothetical protein